MSAAFGMQLKDWRGKRRFSQLDLALTANVSARHIAFLETGRSKPSREMIAQLAEALSIPRADRNALLHAAGFAQTYKRRDLDDAELVHVRDAVTWTLQRHDPYPALAVDRHWCLVMANTAATGLLSGVGLNIGDSMLDAALNSDALRNSIVNWPDVAHHMIVRLRTESAYLGGDSILDAAADQLAGNVKPNHETETLPAIVPTIYRAGDIQLSLFSTIAQFGTAEDIALADLKIELMFPADDMTRNVFLAQAS